MCVLFSGCLITAKSGWEVFLKEICLLLSAVIEVDETQPYYRGTSYEMVCWWLRQ